MVNKTWKQAIIEVLKKEDKALHYTEISQLISDYGYKLTLGATPNETVSSTITTDIKNNNEKSTFIRVGKGIYILRNIFEENLKIESEVVEPQIALDTSIDQFKIIKAFGIFWNRDLVYWNTTPDLLGVQQIRAGHVNFKDQKGIYLLHDGRETIYVGQAISQTLGQRLKHHTVDRLAGRWERFSWFGLYPSDNAGKLITDINLENLTFQNIGDVLEAMLIECMEPRQNRKQGNQFAGLEFLQVESDEITRQKKMQLLSELKDQLK